MMTDCIFTPTGKYKLNLIISLYLGTNHKKRKIINMKSLLKMLIFSFAIFIATDLSAQSFSTTIVKVDTVVKPTAFRIGVNKLDNQLVFWDKVSWKSVAVTLRATATLNFLSSGATTVSDLTVAVPGARLGDEVAVGVPHAAITATASYYGWVSAANTVTIRFSPKATEDPASAVFHVTVWKYDQWK